MAFQTCITTKSVRIFVFSYILYFLTIGVCASGLVMKANDNEVLLKLKALLPAYVDTAPFNTWIGANCTNRDVNAPERWQKVDCYGDGSVARVDLGDLNLSASVTPILKLLTQIPTLIHVFLNDNRLTGGIPPSINNLRSLNILYLKNNSLTGSIPPISDMVSLQVWDTRYNKLSGRIPPIFTLTNLWALGLNDNLLTGPLIAGQLKSTFTDFDVSNNFLSGVPSLPAAGIPDCEKLQKNCFVFNSPSCGAPQRPQSECDNFCNVSQPLGACGGYGTCFNVGGSCTCDPGYSAPISSPATCIASASPPPPRKFSPPPFKKNFPPPPKTTSPPPKKTPPSPPPKKTSPPPKKTPPSPSPPPPKKTSPPPKKTPPSPSPPPPKKTSPPPPKKSFPPPKRTFPPPKKL